MALSVAILNKNGGENLRRALESVKDLAAEIVMIDTGSDDHSIDIAKEYGAFVASMPWSDDFSICRNALNGLCHCDWVLHIDSDEELTDSAKAIIPEIIKGEKVPYIAIIRQTVGEANGFEHWSQVKLFPREGALWHYRVHEQVLYEPSRMSYMHPALVFLHYGDVVSSRDKAEYYLSLAKKDYEDFPDDPHTKKQYAFCLATVFRIGDALELLFSIKDEIQKPRLSDGTVPDVGVVRPVYQNLIGLLRTQEGELVKEVFEKGYGGWWSALEWANLMFMSDQPDEVQKICEFIESKEWDGHGNESRMRRKIAYLKEWAKIEIEDASVIKSYIDMNLNPRVEIV